jgi:hypothetical protein
VSHENTGEIVKEDFLYRLGKSIAIMVGGFLFLYLIIVATQDHPISIALNCKDNWISFIFLRSL